MKWKHFVDSHKLATSLAILVMMALHDQWDNPTAWIYLALHGTYGILWALKSRIFGDKTWEQEITLLLGIALWAGLSFYWVAPWIVTSQAVQAPPWRTALCVSLFGFGVFFHFGSDMQKNITLKLQPGKLITTGMFARCRNPNYFGELLIYLSFVLLVFHWLPAVIFGIFIGYWFFRMYQKDKSLSRYPEFEAYRKQSKLFIPFLF